MTLDGKPPAGSRESPSRYAHYRVDDWRARHERGRKPTCTPGRGGCNGYHFPHRRGSRWCYHNPNLTEDDMREREERR